MNFSKESFINRRIQSHNQFTDDPFHMYFIKSGGEGGAEGKWKRNHFNFTGLRTRHKAVEKQKRGSAGEHIVYLEELYVSLWP